MLVTNFFYPSLQFIIFFFYRLCPNLVEFGGIVLLGMSLNCVSSNLGVPLSSKLIFMASECLFCQ